MGIGLRAIAALVTGAGAGAGTGAGVGADIATCAIGLGIWERVMGGMLKKTGLNEAKGCQKADFKSPL
jgi:hypothetical protein